ncbi:uncharacterized protein SCODWIG_02602 [Saccharomycodes ludwigii]|uniref:Bud site selection protein 21 n=1 Tax=Saccharomycodes ludwigii TaxID=36035 RepID=A0A376B895_9ASCO|nr:hypothetical protein SCDLUD_005289 [Saccharomycodes ludwigii]KAH3898942.1 hypothetical protein SCDLUD_005289 [Saccharomycodes ludwigii]SSD60841.1 uncharacterized protein SCODWIG_02602 [Saccharomycodes ludwigii]
MSSHIKFDSEIPPLATKNKNNLTDTPLDKPVSKKEQKYNNDYNSDSSSNDDEAPEEEGLSESAKKIEENLKKQEEALIQEKGKLKAKRKAQTLKFQEQQKLKQQRLELEKAKLLEFEKQLKLREQQEDESKQKIQALQELPQELFDNLENDEQSQKKENQVPKHINFNDPESLLLEKNDWSENKKSILNEKRKTLKKLRKTQITKNGFIVSKLSTKSTLKFAPKSEKKVLSVRDKWLRRKITNRK